MHAAVVSKFDTAPAYEEFPQPRPTSPAEVLVDVIASGLHPRVRSQASGSHYTSTDQLPLVPGIDGVGRTDDGQLRYFVLPDTSMGAMAEQTVIDLRRSIPLPEGTDAVLLAAAMNPAMSSWVALRQRIDFRPGQSVLVLGATGNAGQLAVQIARHLGAGRVVAAGRNRERLAALAELGADDLVALDGPLDVAAESLGRACSEIEVVLDYLWGSPTEAAMRAVVRHRENERQPLAWVEIGSVAGPTAQIPSAALRAARLQIVGSGQGSVSAGEFVQELPELAAEITSGAFEINVRARQLADVSQAWAEAATSRERLVITT
jgi:NADPH:quinone reductase-like Zn-dependent oxidoreductase